MKKFIYIFIMLLICGNINAQNVIREGDNFTQVKEKQNEQKVYTPTKYTYTDAKGRKYPIYLSKKGKAFIIRKSKEGKEYPQYLPQIGKQINPKAYENN